MCVCVCGSFRSLALPPGAHGAGESQQVAPQPAHLPVPKKAPGTPTPNHGLAPGLNRGLVPTVVHADTIADRAHAQGPAVVVLAAGHTVGSVGAGVTAVHPCPTAAGTLATGPIQIQTVA